MKDLVSILLEGHREGETYGVNSLPGNGNPNTPKAVSEENSALVYVADAMPEMRVIFSALVGEVTERHAVTLGPLYCDALGPSGGNQALFSGKWK